MQDIIAKLHPLERQVLPSLKENTELPAICKASNMKEIEVMRALQWLANKEVLKLSSTSTKLVSLDKNGKIYKEHGLPEKRFLAVLSEEQKGINVITAKSKLSKEEINACLGLLKRDQAIEISKQDNILQAKITEKGKTLLNEETEAEKFLKQDFPIELEKVQDQPIFKELSKRKDFLKVDEKKHVQIELTKLGTKLSTVNLGGEVINRLTSGMLKTGQWKDKTFRGYDVEINVPETSGGRRHPYNEALNIIRNAFLEMGFQEMQGPWVETAFWGMDSMWIPQDHPAREEQDTFYLDQDGDLPEPELVEKVKAAHENGLNTGSTGHTKEWKPELAKKLIMRQHSTATTYRYFHKLKLNNNCKYFYIANNFRNEATDATHLPEFGQAEGFIMGDKLTLADLMGFIKEFYAKLGIHKIRFKPTFNPYTEPSMEAHYYNEKLGKWYALINSGIFRPEALAPYGITKSVIAWGMGSSRIAGILTGKNKLKEIIGPEVDLEWIKKHQRVNV